MNAVTTLPNPTPVQPALAPRGPLGLEAVQRYLYLGRLRLYIGAVAREIGREFTHTRDAAGRLARHVEYLIEAFDVWGDLVKRGDAPADDLVFDTLSVRCACEYLAHAHALLAKLAQMPQPDPSDPWDGEAIDTIDRAYELVLGSERLLSLWQEGRREEPAAPDAYDRAPHKNIGPNEDPKAENVWAELLKRLGECEDATQHAGKTSDSYYELCRKQRALFLSWFHMLALYPGWWSADLQNDTAAALAQAARVMPAGPLQSAAERRVELFRAHFPVVPSSQDPVRYLRLAADPNQPDSRRADLTP